MYQNLNHLTNRFALFIISHDTKRNVVLVRFVKLGMDTDRVLGIEIETDVPLASNACLRRQAFPDKYRARWDPFGQMGDFVPLNFISGSPAIPFHVSQKSVNANMKVGDQSVCPQNLGYSKRRRRGGVLGDLFTLAVPGILEKLLSIKPVAVRKVGMGVNPVMDIVSVTIRADYWVLPHSKTLNILNTPQTHSSNHSLRSASCGLYFVASILYTNQQNGED